MNQFNFKSQICTTVAQSERLLALGLKKDTADMSSVRNLVETTSNRTREVIFAFTPDNWEANHDAIPRWSLHRLIEMMPMDAKVEFYHYNVGYAKVYKVYYNEELNTIELC